MESNKAVIGALLFILLVIGANFVMYAIARGAANSKQKGFLETISKSLNTSTQKKDNSMDELRQKIEELEKGKKGDSGESE
ncbi:MAG: hypothetical protein IPJ46_03930 [Anaerolineales bacterium]|jgi:hypothetical protein|uniref:hypothetical protein n=1 Tax=Candidatus Villigracilis saccharophilus TaxID=3140684 RepID=UPI003136A93D|nr:hypothetical protein [Anaerolineales bacterium]MBK8417982.1 hypothetical protein [Anaerolineales bacterium]